MREMTKKEEKEAMMASPQSKMVSKMRKIKNKFKTIKSIKKDRQHQERNLSCKK
jgi:hypothetical protein